MKKFKIYESEVISLHPYKLTRIDIIDIIKNDSLGILQYEGVTMSEVKVMKKGDLICLFDIIVETYNDWGYYIDWCDKRDIKDEMLRMDLKYSEDQKETISIVKEYLKTA